MNSMPTMLAALTLSPSSPRYRWHCVSGVESHARVSVMESDESGSALIGSDDPMGSDAATALAEIERQHRFVSERLGSYRWWYPVLGLLLGAAVASLAWRGTVLFLVVVTLFLAAPILLFGTPARLGIVPREDRRHNIVMIWVCSGFLFTMPWLASLGPWWVSIVMGVLTAGFVTLFGRWRLATIRADLRQPPTADHAPGLWTSWADRIGTTAVGVAATAVIMGAAVAVLPVRSVVVSAAALLIYWVGLFSILFRMVRRVGELPPEHRPARTWKLRLGSALGGGVLCGAQSVVLLCSRQDRPWVAIVYGVVVMGVVGFIGWWQLLKLRMPATGRCQ